MKKRGISPLIATVLLIAFSVALGAVVMNWGQGFVKDKADDVEKDSDIQLKCSQDVSIEILEINGYKKVCYDTDGDPDQLMVHLTNTGTENITGFQFIVVESNDNINTSSSSTDLDVGKAAVYNATYGSSGSNRAASHFEIIPVILQPGSTKTTTCTGNKLEISEISACT